MVEEQRTLSRAVVAGLRRLMQHKPGLVSEDPVRNGAVTLEVVAQHMRRLGYPWRPDTLAQVDRGTRRLSPEELLGLLAVAEHVFGGDEARPVVLRMLPGDARVELSPGLVLSGATAAALLAPLASGLARRELLPRPEASEVTELDRRVAARLGVSTARLLAAVTVLGWRGLAEEREARLPSRDELPDPVSRSRAAGQVTRQLMRELARHIEGSSDGSRSDETPER